MTSPIQDFSTVFVELDALMDTRLATLGTMGDETVRIVLEDNDYLHRLIDRFKGIDNDEFQKRYQARSKEILALAVVTPIARVIKEFAEKTLQQVASTPFHYQPRILLNVYPYQLEPDEEVCLISAVRGVTNGLADIQIVSMSYEEITPRFVKKELSLMILYNYIDWLELHSANGNFKKTICPEVGLLGPYLCFKMPDSVPDPENDPIKAIETLAQPLIRLVQLPIEYFSMALVKKETV